MQRSTPAHSPSPPQQAFIRKRVARPAASGQTPLQSLDQKCSSVIPPALSQTEPAEESFPLQRLRPSSPGPRRPASTASRSTKSANPTDHHLKLSYAEEAEGLYDVISEAHTSIQLLCAHFSQVQAQVEQLKAQEESLRCPAGDPAVAAKLASVRCTQLCDSLNSKSTEVKRLNREKYLLKASLRDTLFAKRTLKAELRAKQAKLSVLTGHFEGATMGELQQKLKRLRQALDDNQAKVTRYEKYIQAKLNKPL